VVSASAQTRNGAFLKNTYGVDAAPYLRPPYGNHNATVNAVAADLDYTAITLWSGSLSDSTIVTPQYTVAMAKQYFHPQAIVIGHLNHPPVTPVYPTSSRSSGSAICAPSPSTTCSSHRRIRARRSDGSHRQRPRVAATRHAG
jgi:peptidoglycan/xylan/chitin deacetylase (PgdA/CDA1 family)